jgi:hypothetical protein
MKKLVILLSLIFSQLSFAEAIDFQYLSRQKDILKSGDYDQYFGRSIFLKVKARKNNAIRWENEILDIMAFSQLCYFDEAENIASELKKKELSLELAKKLELAREYAELKKQLELRSAKNGKTRKKKGVRTYKWPANLHLVEALSTPKNLRLRIEPKCES